MPPTQRKPTNEQVTSAVRPANLIRTEEAISHCRQCARLVAWREESASTPRGTTPEDGYWARAVPGFGDPEASLLIVGLAPAAHGANRTGRMFTGDRSGDFLFAALHRAGYANQPTSTDRDDGLTLRDAYVTSAVHCAPPMNKPTLAERDACLGFLGEEIAALSSLRVILALGAFALDAAVRQLKENGQLPSSAKRPRFGHGIEVPLGDDQAAPTRTLLCSYHPSQRNVFTGLLTPESFDAILARARELCAQ